MEISEQVLLSLYRTMYKIRYYEETLGKIYYEGKSPFSTFLQDPFQVSCTFLAVKNPPLWVSVLI